RFGLLDKGDPPVFKGSLYPIAWQRLLLGLCANRLEGVNYHSSFGVQNGFNSGKQHDHKCSTLKVYGLRLFSAVADTDFLSRRAQRPRSSVFMDFNA
ncbi:MAG: hypothetical protein ABW101_18805, partial [Candidatus Thiodiazotropha sp.]